MHFPSRLTTFIGIIVLVGLSAVLAVIVLHASTAYAAAQSRCEAFPQNYKFMVTRYHNGACQFRENEGWVTFTPSN